MCERCQKIVDPGTPHDWRVARVVDFGAGEYYRYRVEGENLNWPEGDTERRFSWRIPGDQLSNPRYDLTNAERLASHV